MLLNYLCVFLFTVAFELSVSALWGLRRNELLAVFFVNLFTHPLLHLLLLIPPDRQVWTWLYILEVLIALGEGLLLRFMLQEKAWRLVWLSIVMNVGSFLLGWLVFF